MNRVDVSQFKIIYKEAFARLNQQWIETFFKIETQDVDQLSNPEKYILQPGGEIFFVLEDGIPLGTCAMIPHGENCFELAKMAVAPQVQGKGYGTILMSAAIDWAKTQSADSVVLYSNTKLTPAIRLYEKFGFRERPMAEEQDYERCNIEMILKL